MESPLIKEMDTADLLMVAYAWIRAQQHRRRTLQKEVASAEKRKLGHLRKIVCGMNKEK